MDAREGYHRHRRSWPSPAQRRVLDALAHGGSNTSIARRLGLAFETVKWHVSELLAETGPAGPEAAEGLVARTVLEDGMERGVAKDDDAGSP